MTAKENKRIQEDLLYIKIYMVTTDTVVEERDHDTN